MRRLWRMCVMCISMYHACNACLSYPGNRRLQATPASGITACRGAAAPAAAYRREGDVAHTARTVGHQPRALGRTPRHSAATHILPFRSKPHPTAALGMPAKPVCHAHDARAGRATSFSRRRRPSASRRRAARRGASGTSPTAPSAAPCASSSPPRCARPPTLTTTTTAAAVSAAARRVTAATCASTRA
jgi:hypothetical protein